jgi:hypothetical protein
MFHDVVTCLQCSGVARGQSIRSVSHWQIHESLWLFPSEQLRMAASMTSVRGDLIIRPDYLARLLAIALRRAPSAMAQQTPTRLW